MTKVVPLWAIDKIQDNDLKTKLVAMIDSGELHMMEFKKGNPGDQVQVKDIWICTKK